jgi:protein-S-isoprenylcysteine O-methyltransferase Ste14
LHPFLYSVLVVGGWTPMLVRLRAERTSGAPAQDRLLLTLTWMLCIALTVASAWDMSRARTGSGGRIATGIALQWVAMSCWSWARAAMGTSFAQVGLPPDLVVRGPYRHVRHPMYAATGAAALGLAIAGGRERDFVLVAALGVVLIVRAAREELVLRRHFGNRWDAYARESLGLVPPFPVRA